MPFRNDDVNGVPVHVVLFASVCDFSWLVLDLTISDNLITLEIFFDDLGYTKSEAGLLVAVSAALDLIGRLGFGYLSDLQLFDRKKAYIVW